jgi:hypothetical protein
MLKFSEIFNIFEIFDDDFYFVLTEQILQYFYCLYSDAIFFILILRYSILFYGSSLRSLSLYEYTSNLSILTYQFRINFLYSSRFYFSVCLFNDNCLESCDFFFKNAN